MRPPLPARVQGLSRRSRLGGGRRVALGHRHAVAAVPQGAGVAPPMGGELLPVLTYGDSTDCPLHCRVKGQLDDHSVHP